MKRRCGRCKKNRLLKFFKKKTPTCYQSYCVGCQSSYRRGHYETNRADYIARAQAQTKVVRKKLKDFIDALKRKPCLDCRNSYPAYVMQFDHRPGENKSFEVGEAVRLKLSE